jgi:hypothetical protein
LLRRNKVVRHRRVKWFLQPPPENTNFGGPGSYPCRIARRVSGRLEKIALVAKLLPLFALFFALLGIEALILRAE